MELILFVFSHIIIFSLLYRLSERVKDKYMEYLSLRETAEKWGVSIRRVQVLCNGNRIPGATKIGSFWVIPKEAEKPKNQRIKSGKYIKKVE